MKSLALITGGLLAAVLTMMALSQQGPVQCVAEVAIVDENSRPIAGVKVVAGFTPGGALGGASQPQEGMTDAEGKVKLTGQSIFPISIYATKDGYYRSHTELPIQLEKKVGIYVPDNNPRATVLLRKIKNPIPMYAKRVNLKVPVLDKSIGFDFQAGDWVAPHGLGKTAMVQFMMTKKVTSQDDYIQTLEMSFPRKGDGISSVKENEGWMKSEFKWPYQALEQSFEDKASFVRSRGSGKAITTKAGENKHLLRLKTQMDASGQVKSCNYVRVERDLSLYGVLSDEPGIKFIYYFNPTPNDRNLEFDPAKNLFGKIPRDERVTDP